MMGGPGSGPKRKPMGRPTKLTPELQADLVRLIEAGNYVETAAGCCGVQPATVRDWVKRGVRGHKTYRGFSTALKKAEARAEASGVVRIRAAAKNQWQADAWFLERKFPQRWGRKSRDEPSEAAPPTVNVYLPDNGRVPSDRGKEDG